ncbi:MAG: VapC toxin family PIN domain ribonuclease, partial [Balneola sp.]
MILADSSIWIDFFKDTNNEKVDALVEYLSRERVISADLVVTEVLQGFRKDSDFLTAVDIFNSIP